MDFSRARWGAAAVLLFLVVVTDFTSKMLSMLIDGVLVAGVVCLLWPIFKGSNNDRTD